MKELDEKSEEKELKEKITSLIEQCNIKGDVKSRMELLSSLKKEIPHMKHEYQEMIELFKTLGNENRIMILLLIAKGLRCPCELESALGLSQSTIWHHLNALVKAGIIQMEKSGKWNLLSTQESITPQFFHTLLDAVYIKND